MVIFVSTINEYLITLALETIGSKKAVIAEFIMNQSSIFNTTVTLAVILTSIGYITLSFHLYSKVSGAVFAYFATMRSFMRGNHEARVHLIGYAHIRPHGRAFNKYLDLVARECRTEDNKS